MGGGFKMGVVKYIGETEFAPGEWIGVAFDKPSGEWSVVDSIGWCDGVMHCREA